MKRIKGQKYDEMRAEYDFSKGVRGKYYRALGKGYTVRLTNEDGSITVKDFVPNENTVLLDPDVKAYFPDSDSVNHALRSLINLIPEKRVGRVAENRAKYSRKWARLGCPDATLPARRGVTQA